MTRDEFEEWLEENTPEALDSAQQSDASAQDWLGRLYALLKPLAKEEDTEDEEEDGDSFDGDDEDEEDEEEDEEEEA